MARAVWSGMISFGLVSVPVGLFTATQEHQPSFHQFAEGGTDRIRYKRVNERTGKEVDFAKIDPLYFNKAYFLAPSGDESKKTYALLRDAMAATNRAGIGTFVMHGKEHLAAIRATGNTLVLETLFFADEVRDAKSMLDNLPGKTTFSKGELTMATQLIESMAERWNPQQYRDTYTDRVNDLISSKRKGKDFTAADEAPDATNVVDLLEALRQSVDSARGKPKKATAKRTAAKKAPAKRSRKAS